MNRFVLLTLTIICVSSCSSLPKESNDSSSHQMNMDCINPKESSEGKVQLENGIRNQVKFLGEPEDLSSIKNKMLEYKIPAISLAVINRGHIEWANVYQNPHFIEVQKLNCTSLFQAASLSKPLTVLAALRMYSAGEIDLDKNIQSYLKDFVLPLGKQTADNPVTFRNIFSHTSGISPGGYDGYAKALVLPSDLDILKEAQGLTPRL